MATVIKAVGATFKASNLVKLYRFVEDGLVAAYRPDNSATGLKDLSGNGHTLSLVGGATVTDKALISNSKTSGASTGLSETADLTYISVFKIESVGGAVTSLPVTCFNNPSSGSSIFAGRNVAGDINAQAFASNASNAYSNVITAGTTTNNPANYVFAATRVSATDNTIKIDIPSMGISVSGTIPSGKTIADRTLSPFGVHLGYCPSFPTTLGRTYIAEAVIYNKSLSNEQIAQQYSYSKEGLKAKGIAI